MNPIGADDLLTYVQAIWANEQLRMAAMLLGAAAICFLVLPGGKRASTAYPGSRAETETVRRPTNSPAFTRLRWKVRTPHDMMRVDGLTIERTGKKSHCLWLGPTGAGKSASVATVRVDGARPTLIVTPDLSDPMIANTRALGGFHYTACDASIPVDFLIGTPAEVAERLTEVFRSGGAGVWKMTARRATTHAIADLDSRREHRTLLAIGELLREAVHADRELRVACAGWVERFLATAEQFGDSMGSGGEDIAELLRDGQTVLLDNDAFRHPGLVGDIVAFGLAEAKRCADLVPGGFRLVFEEAGQLGERIDLADPFFRAGRRRKIAVDALTQAESDLDDAITQNSGSRFYFAQELKSLQKVAADRLEMDYREVGPRMADYTAWVASGKIRRLVHFPKPRNAPPSAADGQVNREWMGETDGETRMVVSEVPRAQPKREGVTYKGVPMLPPPGTALIKILDKLYEQGSCERWAGKHDKDGYGLVWLDGRWQKVHRVRYELAYGGIPRNADGTTQTLDHLSGVCAFKDCSKLTHLELVSRGENTKRRWGAAKARPGQR